MIFIKNTNFSREETVGSYISSQIKDVVEPIETIEKNKATVYGGLGGAAIGALLGGAGTMLSRGKDKKNKKALRNALIGAGIGGIGGALGLRYLQGRKFENVADQGKDWLEKMAPIGISKIKDPQQRSEMEDQVKQTLKHWDKPIYPFIRRRKLEEGRRDFEKIKFNVKEFLKSEYDKNVPWWAMSNPFKSEIAIEDI